jgi:cytochrome c oxidase subunit 2
MLWLGTLGFVVFCALLAVAMVRRRGDDPGEPDDRGRRGLDTGFERGWLIGAGIVQPVLLVGAVLVLTLMTMRAIPDAAAEDSLVVEITGHQFWYEITYPDSGVVTANEIHIPVGEEVQLNLSSADVVHSFWVPQLSGKTDMFPDRDTQMVISADRAGSYAGRCAEFCGIQHTRMGVTVIAEDRESFEEWLDAQAEPAVEPDTQIAATGQEVLLSSNCTQCHGIAGVTGAPEVRGPDLTHLASRSTIGAGTVVNDPQQLRDWIRDPHDVKEGVDMPPSPLDGEQLDALVAYLRSLD